MAKSGPKGPVKLTEAVIESACQKILDGVGPEVAFIASGVSRSTFFELKRKAQNGDQPFLDYWTFVARAEAEHELKLARAAATGDEAGVGYGPSKAALELLQLRFPKRWSKQVKLEIADQLNRFLDAAQRVCSPEDFAKLLEVLAEEPGEGEAPGAPGPAEHPIH